MMRLLALIPLAFAKRHKASDEWVQCEITTEHGAKVIFPVNKCQTQCVMATHWDDVDTSQQNKQFSSSFDVQYFQSKDKCVCNVKGKPRIQFKPVCKKGHVCEEACMQNSKDAKEQCWESYKRLAATVAVKEGELTTFRQGERFAHDSDFQIVKTCTACPDGACRDATIPPVTEYLTGETKTTLHQQIEEKKAAGTLSGFLKEIDDMLTDSDHGNLAWSVHDTDGDGQLSIDELHKVYPDVPKPRIAEIVAKIDTNGDDQVNEEEFARFQEIIFSKWTFLPKDGQSAIFACVNSETGETGECLGTLEAEIAKATHCVN